MWEEASIWLVLWDSYFRLLVGLFGYFVALYSTILSFYLQFVLSLLLPLSDFNPESDTHKLPLNKSRTDLLIFQSFFSFPIFPLFLLVCYALFLFFSFVYTAYNTPVAWNRNYIFHNYMCMYFRPLEFKSENEVGCKPCWGLQQQLLY